MRTTPLRIYRHGLQPFLYFDVQDHDGNPIDLTGYTFSASFKEISGSALKFNNRTTGISFSDTDGGDNIQLGRGHFEWQAGDTDTAGTYDLEIDFIPPSGKKFPRVYRVVILEDVDNE